MRTPRQVDLEVTSRCNLRCSYCYYFNNPAVDYHDLPTEEWLQFFEELGRCAVMSVTLQGGEPFARRDIRRLIEGIVENRMRYSILTNGILIDDAMAGFMAETKRCNAVQVSVDGASDETHGASRGPGSFERTVKGIRTLQRHGVNVAVRVTINRHNVADLDNIAKFLLEDLGLPSFGTNAAGYLGACRKNANDTMLTRENRIQSMATLKRLADQYNGRIVATAGPLSEARSWENMLKASAENAPPIPGGGHLTACGCVYESMAVRSDGVFVPCVLLAHLEMGRINHDSLEDVWQNSAALEGLRTRRTVPLTKFKHCSDCPYTRYCTGNCPGLAYSLTGEVNRPSPDACLKSFLKSGSDWPSHEAEALAEEIRSDELATG